MCVSLITDEFGASSYHKFSYSQTEIESNGIFFGPIVNLQRSFNVSKRAAEEDRKKSSDMESCCVAAVERSKLRGADEKHVCCLEL